LFNNLISKDKELQKKVEDRLLFLIQLWFDTFMLHQEDFKPIIEVYNTLWKEGVVFPNRDPKSQFFINFKGKKSPIFDSIEGNFIYEEPTKVISKRNYTVKEIKIT